MSSVPSNPPRERTSLRRLVQDKLRAQDARSMYGSLGRLLGGIAWCLVAGFVFATALTLSTWATMEEPPLRFGTWLLIYLLILVPVLALMERHHHRAYVVASLSPTETDAVAVDRPRSMFGPIVQFFTWGPRALIDGQAGVRGKWKAHQNAVFRRAAKLLLELATYSGGVEIKHLLHPPEDMGVFGKAVDWLDRHDWIGKSSNGDRLWISTDGRRKLADDDLLPKVDEFKV